MPTLVNFSTPRVYGKFCKNDGLFCHIVTPSYAPVGRTDSRGVANTTVQLLANRSATRPHNPDADISSEEAPGVVKQRNQRNLLLNLKPTTEPTSEPERNYVEPQVVGALPEATAVGANTWGLGLRA